jgi:predicted ATPase
LTVLATSREALGVPGELLWPTPPLSVADSTDLFVQRASAIAPRFAPDAGHLATIADICTRLDGMPLAIELAAARVRALALDEIAARLDDRFSRGTRRCRR